MHQSLYLLALSQELPCFSGKEVISVTRCTNGTCMNVLFWMYKRVSDFVCAYHLHYIVMAYLFLRRKKTLKQYKSVTVSYVGVLFFFCFFVAQQVDLEQS